MRELLIPSMRLGDIVVMDYRGAHKNERTLHLIKQAGAETRFLPAYSPNLKSIEMMWSKVKALLRKDEARTPPDLLKAHSLSSRRRHPAVYPRLVCTLWI